jgi:hypothetical protein
MRLLNPIAKGLQSTSLRDSINAHCYMCMGGLKEDIKTHKDVVSDIQGCNSKICPLRSVRPFTPSKSVGNLDK